MTHPHEWRNHRRAHTGILLSSAALVAVVLGWGVLAMGSTIEGDDALRVEAADTVAGVAAGLGRAERGRVDSAVAGPKGNREIFLWIGPR